MCVCVDWGVCECVCGVCVCFMRLCDGYEAPNG